MIQSKYWKDEAERGLICMPRKIEGKAIRTIVASMEAIRVPIVVFDNATHLYCTIKSALNGIFSLAKRFMGYKKFAWELVSSQLI
jgi:hypothetical protein